MTKDFSLWLMPAKTMAIPHQKCIENLALRFATDCFPPHITFIGKIRRPQYFVEKKAKELCAVVPPFTATLHELGWQNKHFRCFYWKARESREIAMARKAIHSAIKTKEAFLEPHLSLIYGRLEKAAKESLARELSTQAGRRLRLRYLTVVSMARDVSPQTWRQLKTFRLGAKGR